MALRDDANAREVMAFALTAVGAARVGLAEPLDYDGPEPDMVPWGIAEIAAIALDELDKAGGDSAAVMERIYLAVAGGHTEGAGHG
jgi:hypothetical protein